MLLSGVKMRFSFVILIISWSIFSFAATNPSNILFVHSYDDQYHWDQGLTLGFKKGMTNQLNVNIYHEYMDAKRFPGLDNRLSFYHYLSDKYRGRELKAIVIADDPAMDLYLEHSENKFNHIPVFFMGINKFNAELQSSQHIAGIFEKRDLQQALIDIKAVLGKDQVIVLADTSATGVAMKELIHNAQQSPMAPQQIYYLDDVTPETLASKLTPFPKDIPIFVAGQLRNSQTAELINWEQAYIELELQVRNPFFGLFTTGLNYGALASYQLDPELHAKQATQLLVNYLQGIPIDEIETVTELDSTWHWNEAKLKQYQINKNQLPDGSVIVGQQNEVYELNKTTALLYALILFVSIVVILLLLIILTKNRQAQRVLIEKVSLTEKLAYQASHDYLTGLLNRRTFNTLLTKLEDERFQSRRHTNIYIAILDLDNFKTINDTAGHMVGDNLLTEISNLMTQYVCDDDILARLGGDEFGLILKNRTEQEAEKLCFDIIDAVSEYRIVWNETRYSVGVSIGVVRARENDRKEVLMSHADIACYKAKELGINHAYFTDAKDSGIQLEQLQLGFITDITTALEHNQFFLAKQLILPLNHTETHPHYEILLRYNDKEGKAVPPGLFIPAAEKHGLITLIDKWVVQTVFSQYKALFPHETPMVSINLSGVSLSNANFLDDVLAIVNNADIDMRKVCFEVTETAAVSNISRAITFIHELKKTGCKFALDDFGSGSSSYGYLKKLPVDYLKIDGSLIRSIIGEPIDQTIVKSINDIAHQMGMKTIAEFVENDQIKQKLHLMGVDYGQGYGIHKPEICIKSHQRK
jgi:diguanylate cyclase (GGDEF)-like protein